MLFALALTLQASVQTLSPVRIHLRHGAASSSDWQPGIPTVISDDGSTLFHNGGGVIRTDLKTGRSPSIEDFRVAVTKGIHAHPISRTTSQNITQTNGILGDSIKIWGEAPDMEHLLVCSNIVGSTPQYVVLTEINFKKRGPSPNLDWLLPTLGHGDVLPLQAGFAKNGTAEVWIVEPNRTGRNLVRFVGAADGSLKRSTQVQLTYPLYLGEGIVTGSFDPAKRTYVYQGEPRAQSPDSAHPYITYCLANVQGRVLKTTRIPGLPVSNRDLQAVWQLTVPNSSVPGGTAAWIAESRSGDRRFWLIRNRVSKELKLLHLPPQG